MSKQLRQYLRRSLCGILSAAMILTGSIIPDISVLAAQPAVENPAENNDADGQENNTPSVENKGAIQNLDADGSDADGNESDAVGSGSGKEDEGTEVTSPDEDADSDDEENNDIEDDAKENDGDDDDVKEVPNEGIAVIADDNSKSYTNAEVTLNYYIEGLGDNETLGLFPWGSTITVDDSLKLDWKAWVDEADENSGKIGYKMESVEGSEGWYKITFTVTDTLTMKEGECKESLAGFDIVRSSKPNDEGVIFGCSGWKKGDIYKGLLDGTVTAVKDEKGYASIAAAEGEGGGETTEGEKYTDREVTLNYYVGELETGDETIGFCPWSDEGGSLTFDTNEYTLLGWGGWDKPTDNPAYQMSSVDGHEGWYSITFTVTDTLTATASLAGFSVFRSSDVQNGFECSGYKNPNIYKGLLDGTMKAVKGGVGYASIEDAEVSVEKLKELVEEAKELKEEDYKEAGWKVFWNALQDAEAVLAKEDPASSEIEEAYDDLDKAMRALKPKSVIESEINVDPIALADDFITGADISSYWALKESGTVFKDENGKALSDAEFFQYLHDGGTNWIRIRIWNDPYDSVGNGYGGGNNDLDKAKIMGKLATDAGMRVLIDFHYSDFWADPGKQQAPKAWAGMSVDDRADAVYQFTKDSLNELKSAGVDVGMVQVGNETTQGICGVKYDEDGWEAAAEIYKAGSKAVKEFDKKCLVAVHFTNPEKTGAFLELAENLDINKVEYDVLATSYYPYWHGTTDNLTYVLTEVAKKYGKKVMVAETSWATTLDDQDGHENTVYEGHNDTVRDYAFSVQGQADEIRAVVEAVNKVNSEDGAAGSAIGVFYWESAWISPYYVYDEDGDTVKKLLNRNKAAWEAYGSGWASSYAAEYDPKDAGVWYGGSAVDNQAWFGFDGTALATAKVYSYIRTGSTAEKAISDMENPSVTITAGGTVEYPENVIVRFNDGTEAECPVEWNKEDQAQVDTNEPGDHTVRGIVTCEYTGSDGSTKTAKKSVTLTITVKMDSVEGLANPGFENEVTDEDWELDGVTRKNENPRDGSFAAHFWCENDKTVSVKQEVKGLAAGTYIFGGYIEGADADADAVVTVYKQDGTPKGEVMKSSCSLEGWMNWKNPEISGIVIEDGDYLVVGMEVAVKAGGWGTMDDFYLASAYEYEIQVDGQTAHGTLSCDVGKSISGEKIEVKAEPAEGYILSKLTVSGRGVTGATLTDEHGTVAYDSKRKMVVLTYAAKVTEEMAEFFIMPNSKVTISAVFRTNVELSELDSLIEQYERVLDVGYSEESWNAFTAALEAAEKALDNLEATQAEIDKAKEALETAYKGLKAAPATSEAIKALSDLIEEYEKLTSDDYTEESWATFAEALEAAKAAAAKADATKFDIADAKKALEAAYKGLTKTEAPDPAPAREGLWAEWTPEWAERLGEDNTITYTGKAIKPTVMVYDGETLLTSKSYSVSYKKNKKPGEASVVITGKGNYTGSHEMNFTIDYVDLENDSDISIAPLYAAAPTNDTPVSPKPVVTWKGKKVDAKYYTVEYPDQEEDAYVAPGAYTVVVSAKKDNGIYKGSREINVELVDTAEDAHVLMSKVTVKLNVSSKKWKEGGVTLDADDIKVTYNKNNKNNKLTLDTDYELEYENNEQIGTATVIITGLGKFVGEQRKTFKITGKEIKKSAVQIDTTTPMVYNGSAHTPEVTVGELEEGKDYVLTYQNNINAGNKAAVVVKGINGYSGTVKKTFKIAAHGVKKEDVSITVDDTVYAKGGSKPPVTVTFNGSPLVQGKDYTVSYNKNAKATNGAKTAEATIKGKGNFNQTKTVKFAIAKQSLSAVGMKATAADQTKASKWNKVSPVIKDLNGKTLKKGTDYKNQFTYTLYDLDGNEVTDRTANPPAAGMKVKVTATGIGSYTGTIDAEYRIINKNNSIAGARIKIKNTPVYTGKPIELDKSNITLEVKKGGKWTALKDNEYEIVGYSNNTKKGNAAKVTIHGLAPYGGTKTFKFKIKAQSMTTGIWAERMASMFEMMFN